MERTFEVANNAESDLAIHCEDSVFHVHRALLSLASPVWDRMLNGEFAESVSDTIVFEEDCPRALGYVLEILYFPEQFSMYTLSGSETDLEALLDKYQLSGVRTIIDRMKRMTESAFNPFEGKFVNPFEGKFVNPFHL